jgi:hypothetical protein
MGQEEKTKAASEEQQGQSSVQVKNRLAIIRNSARAVDLFSRMLYAVQEQFRRNQGKEKSK